MPRVSAYTRNAAESACSARLNPCRYGKFFGFTSGITSSLSRGVRHLHTRTQVARQTVRTSHRDAADPRGKSSIELRDFDKTRAGLRHQCLGYNPSRSPFKNNRHHHSKFMSDHMMSR